MKLASSQYPPGEADQKNISLATALAILIIVIVTAQLMTMEKFVPIIENYQLPGGSLVTKITVFTIVTSGVLSLPFLLRMRLSAPFRFFSAFLLNLHALSWVGLGLWVFFNKPSLIGTGIFGGLLRSIPQDFILPFSTSLLITSVFITWLLRKDLIFNH